MPDIAELRSTAQRWKEAEPDADMRDELQALLDGPDDVLTDRFTGRLQFGTAGLRAAVGAGPQRMNRLVVQQAAAGLVDYLLAQVPGAAEAGVIIGYDARRKSDVFAMDTARVCAAKPFQQTLKRVERAVLDLRGWLRMQTELGCSQVAAFHGRLEAVNAFTASRVVCLSGVSATTVTEAWPERRRCST